MIEYSTAAELMIMDDFAALVNAWDGREFTKTTGEVDRYLRPEERRLKNSAMLEDEYSLLRATNEVYWKSLVHDERMTQYSTDGTVTIINGDMHLDNMGISMIEEILHIRMNDFDEGVLADYKYDLVRMAASMLLAFGGHSRPRVKEAVKAMVLGYFTALEEIDKTGLSLTQIRKDHVPEMLQRVFDNVPVSTEEEFIRSITKEKHGQRMFTSSNRKGKLVKAKKSEHATISAGISEYWQRLSEEGGTEG